MVYKRLERILVQLETVDSTNDYAANLIKMSKASEGLTVLSRKQLKGRGQRSSVWTTQDEKNLTFSTILFPKLEVKHVFYLSMVAAIAVSKVLSDLELKPKIKWPNDILINDKKISGILIENQIGGHQINSSIIGIGFNINQTSFKNLPNATSIMLEKNVALDLGDVFNQLYGYIDFYYNHLLDSNFKLIQKHYYKRMYRLGELAEYESDGLVFSGTIEGVDDSGLLQILVDGKRKVFDLKEISFI